VFVYIYHFVWSIDEMLVLERTFLVYWIVMKKMNISSFLIGNEMSNDKNEWKEKSMICFWNEWNEQKQRKSNKTNHNILFVHENTDLRPLFTRVVSMIIKRELNEFWDEDENKKENVIYITHFNLFLFWVLRIDFKDEKKRKCVYITLYLLNLFVFCVILFWIIIILINMMNIENKPNTLNDEYVNTLIHIFFDSLFCLSFH